MPALGRQLTLNVMVQLSPANSVLVAGVDKPLFAPEPVYAVLPAIVGHDSVTAETVYCPAVGVVAEYVPKPVMVSTKLTLVTSLVPRLATRTVIGTLYTLVPALNVTVPADLVIPSAELLLATDKHDEPSPLMTLLAPERLLAVLVKSGAAVPQLVLTALATRLVNGAVIVQPLMPEVMVPPANFNDVELAASGAPPASVTSPPQVLLVTGPLNFNPTGNVSVKSTPDCAGLVVALVSVNVMMALLLEATVGGDVNGEVLKLLLSVGRPSTTKHAMLPPYAKFALSPDML
jgi:hypothetical protein